MRILAYRCVLAFAEALYLAQAASNGLALNRASLLHLAFGVRRGRELVGVFPCDDRRPRLKQGGAVRGSASLLLQVRLEAGVNRVVFDGARTFTERTPLASCPPCSLLTRPGVSGDRIPWKDLSYGTSQ